MEDSDDRSSIGFWVCLGLAALSLLACWPGLGGSWVYDDLRMVGNPLYTELTSLIDLFTRTSADYMAVDAAGGRSATYRPVTMATLVVTHALAPKPWAHHLVGWGLHLVTAYLLYRALAPREPGTPTPTRPSVAAMWLAALFLLHPATVESYVWINGRSDLVAGASLAALAAVRPGRIQVSKSIWLLWALLSFAGAAAKLPFVVAAAFLWLGNTLRAAPQHRLRNAGAFGSALLVGVSGYVALRRLYAPLNSDFPSGTGVFDDPGLFTFMPKLAAMAAETLVSLKPEAMRALAWSAVRSWELGEIVGAALVVLGFSALLLRRDWGGLAYVTGAFCTLAPVAIVTRLIWLGFDRYLYMPLILILLALAPYLESLLRRPTSFRWMPIAAASLILLVASLNTRAASSAYRSHEAFLHALISERPDDPSARMFVATDVLARGDKALAAQAMEDFPDPPWPQANIIPQLFVAQALGDSAAYDRAIEYGSREYGADPFIRAYAMRWHYEAGRLDSALGLASAFPRDHSLCVEIARQLSIWARSAVDTDRSRILEAAENLKCATESG